MSNLKSITIFTLLVFSLLPIGCATSPTGMQQLKLFPDSQMAEMGVAAYSEMKKNTPVTTNMAADRYVKCVANAIIDVLPEKSSWEINVFEDKQINAFALPGGKIGVYTGLLGVAQSPSQLATVVGHEVAHVLADHGNARVSANYAVQAGVTLGMIIGAATIEDPKKRELLALLGVGAQVGVLLPYGRAQESEADIIGLELMAKAGFEPRESVQLWRNMAAAGGKAGPEFLSTHPSSNTRIKDLSARMSNALNLYRQAQTSGRKPACQKPA